MYCISSSLPCDPSLAAPPMQTPLYSSVPRPPSTSAYLPLQFSASSASLPTSLYAQPAPAVQTSGPTAVPATNNGTQPSASTSTATSTPTCSASSQETPLLYSFPTPQMAVFNSYLLGLPGPQNGLPPYANSRMVPPPLYDNLYPSIAPYPLTSVLPLDKSKDGSRPVTVLPLVPGQEPLNPVYGSTLPSTKRSLPGTSNKTKRRTNKREESTPAISSPDNEKVDLKRTEIAIAPSKPTKLPEEKPLFTDPAVQDAITKQQQQVYDTVLKNVYSPTRTHS